MHMVSMDGIIIPVKWSADGEVAAIAIATIDERQFRVDEESGRGRELRRYLRKTVRLQGIIQNPSAPESTIVVHDFRTLRVRGKTPSKA